jgi:hypothetical protein
MNDPSFGDYGRLIFPIQKEHLFGNTLEELQMTFYNCISPDDTVSVIDMVLGSEPSQRDGTRKQLPSGKRTDNQFNRRLGYIG